MLDFFLTLSLIPLMFWARVLNFQRWYLSPPTQSGWGKDHSLDILTEHLDMKHTQRKPWSIKLWGKVRHWHQVQEFVNNKKNMSFKIRQWLNTSPEIWFALKTNWTIEISWKRVRNKNGVVHSNSNFWHSRRTLTEKLQLYIADL